MTPRRLPLQTPKYHHWKNKLFFLELLSSLLQGNSSSWSSWSAPKACKDGLYAPWPNEIKQRDQNRNAEELVLLGGDHVHNNAVDATAPRPLNYKNKKIEYTNLQATDVTELAMTSNLQQNAKQKAHLSRRSKFPEHIVQENCTFLISPNRFNHFQKGSKYCSLKD